MEIQIFRVKTKSKMKLEGGQENETFEFTHKLDEEKVQWRENGKKYVSKIFKEREFDGSRPPGGGVLSGTYLQLKKGTRIVKNESLKKGTRGKKKRSSYSRFRSNYTKSGSCKWWSGRRTSGQ